MTEILFESESTNAINLECEKSMPTSSLMIHRVRRAVLAVSSNDFACGRAMITRLLMLFVFATIPAANAFAQNVDGAAVKKAGNADWHFRYELFQMLLEERGLSTINSLDEAFASPRDSVIVVIGKLNRDQASNADKLPTFVALGGTALVALDSTASMGGIASFTSTPITSEDSATRYQGHADCLRVTDLNESHPLMKGVGEIIVNRSGWLVLQPSNWMKWEFLATVPETCMPRRSRGQPLIAASRSKSANAGTMIVAADPSLLTNSMLWHGDNAILAIRLSELLSRGKKSRLAFIVDGQPLRSFWESSLLQDSIKTQTPIQVPPLNAVPPKPTLENTLQLANSVIQNVEESNILNEALIDQPRRFNRRLYSSMLLICMITVVAAWLFLKLEHTAAARPPPPLMRGMQTAHALLKEGKVQAKEYGRAAQTLARDLCQELSAGACPDWRECLADPTKLPFWETMKIPQRRELAAIVELAASSDAPHISSRRLRQIGAIIQTMRELHSRRLASANVNGDR